MKLWIRTLFIGLLVVAASGLGSCTLFNCLDPLVGSWRMDSTQDRGDCTFYPNQIFELVPHRGVRSSGVWTRYGSHLNVMFDNGEVRTWRYAVAADGKTMTILTEGAQEEVTLYKTTTQTRT